MRLIDVNKIRDYVKGQINPYGKPFDGSAYEFGLKLIKYLEDMPTDYDIDKVVEELDCDRCESCSFLKVCAGSVCCQKCHKKIIEIVKQGGVTDDVCEWKIDGVYLRSPHNRPFVTCIADDEDYRYNFCPVCGKKIKVVE